MLLTYKENVHSTQMYIPLKPLFSRHKGIGVQFTDEPTGNLDSANSSEVIGLLKSCAERFHQTVLVVTHQEEVAQMADRIIRIEDGKYQMEGERMETKTFIPNQNQQVLGMLAREFGKWNRGRNRILMSAVTLCIVTLTMVFGIASGKTKAEYIKAVRAEGTTASVRIEHADNGIYQKIEDLSYVKESGRSISVGEATVSEKHVCNLEVLDTSAWNKMVSPAYTEIHGHYPEKKQELMLSAKSLQQLGIETPKQGMKLSLTVQIGLFQTAQETFLLSGWYMDYTDSQASVGYVSEEKGKEWGYDLQETLDILLAQTDGMEWQKTEERLYRDLGSKELKITADNTFAYEAINRLTGGYELAACGALVILFGMFLLIYNVMKISMNRDIQQMGLLYTIGTTKRQIKRIYFRQILAILLPGVLLGSLFSGMILYLLIPEILGSRYLNGYGGSGEFQVFSPAILLAAVGFAMILTLGTAWLVIRHVVSTSCVESSTAIYGIRQPSKRKVNLKKRTKTGEIGYMAWQNVRRYKGRFLLTVISLFLGVEMLLASVVITEGGDYTHVIEKRPDFLIAGMFSDWGMEQGYGKEYQSRDAGYDPMETEGDNFELLYGNEYEEFSPVSSEVRDRLLELDGVNREDSYVMEGAYLMTTISGKGIRPLEENEQPLKEKEDSMLEGFTEDTVQILTDEEMEKLARYVKEKNLPVDIESLKEGDGVVILHDHQLNPKQEEEARESVGEPLYFSTMLSERDWRQWNQLSPKERDEQIEAENMQRKQSPAFCLSGYLDNRAEGFPDIRQTWHGSEGIIYFLISEKGFAKIPTEKKTLYMELNVENKKEAVVRKEIQNILEEENKRRRNVSAAGVEDQSGEAGIFCISKSELLENAKDYIQGNRIIFGSISIVLLMAGMTNYLNIVVTGIFSRKKELEIMERVGMTKRQKRMLFMMEGGYYFCAVTVLLVTIGSVMLQWIKTYMEIKLSYFVFQYPLIWLVVGLCCLAGISFAVPAGLYMLEKSHCEQ